MKVYLAVPRGFCAGVVRAIDIVQLALKKFGPPIYVKHQIVHNQFVVNSLDELGAITVENVSDVPMGSNVVFSAHGSPPEDYEIARARNLKVIDGTCPLVTKVHNEAHKYSKDGRKIILIGHKGHQEVIGTMGQEPMELFDDREDKELPSWNKEDPVVVLTQTTLSVDDTEKSIKSITDNFKNVVVKNDLCYATTNRQESVKVLAKKVDLILVIGSSESSNCNRLRDVAIDNGVQSYLINGSKDLDLDWVKDIDKIGITSGASTPDLLVDEVINFLNPDEVVEVKITDENVSFVLPDEFK
ncbi:MAG: 4-hydroxy-3-methylbut-2-enyl diphosphate reductase [SAR202 cluster bacterium]|nr:4-hydroxy-3-methylbut-2-enyl diphosphate reductase [SAR202 cluster bacterium]